MMAFDRTPSSPGLAPETVTALREALSASVLRGGLPPDLTPLLRGAADEARAKGISAERLLVFLKDIWNSLPEVASAPSPDAAHELLQHLISRCIHAYYSA